MQKSSQQSNFPTEVVADVEETRFEELSHRVDTSVLAPLRIIASDWRGLVGSLIILFYVFLGTVVVYFTEPSKPMDGPLLLGAFQSPEFVLGTDSLGRDVLMQLIHSTPAMLKMMIAGAGFVVTVGTIVGMVAGYKGGRVDRILMTAADIGIAVPGLPLIVVIAAILEPRNPYLIGVLIVINGWAGLSRKIRGEVLSIREESYVEASRALGFPTYRIVRYDILPNILPYVAMQFVGASRGVIYGSVGLYFLGLLPFTNLNWGVMMNSAYQEAGVGASYTYHWLFTPMIAIAMISLGLTLFAQAADRLFNPRIRAKHESQSPDTDTMAR